MNKIYKSLIIIILSFFIICILSKSSIAAGYSSNKGGSATNKSSASEFFENIRKMETIDGTLGVNSNIDENFNDSSNNKIDCHMAKITELGTTTLLQRSLYGDTGTYNISADYSGASGSNSYKMTAQVWINNSGTVVQNNNITNLVKAYNSSGNKYVNVYSGDNYDSKPGDTLDFYSKDFTRSLSDSTPLYYFCYYNSSAWMSPGLHINKDAKTGAAESGYARAVIVNGEGIK